MEVRTLEREGENERLMFSGLETNKERLGVMGLKRER